MLDCHALSYRSLQIKNFSNNSLLPEQIVTLTGSKNMSSEQSPSLTGSSFSLEDTPRLQSPHDFPCPLTIFQVIQGPPSNVFILSLNGIFVHPHGQDELILVFLFIEPQLTDAPDSSSEKGQ
jgi:hypothetical protein